MVSYELALVLSVMGVLLVSGTLRPTEIVDQQAGWFWNWNVFGGWQFLGFLIFVIAGSLFMLVGPLRRRCAALLDAPIAPGTRHQVAVGLVLNFLLWRHYLERQAIREFGPEAGLKVHGRPRSLDDQLALDAQRLEQAAVEITRGHRQQKEGAGDRAAREHRSARRRAESDVERARERRSADRIRIAHHRLGDERHSAQGREAIVQRIEPRRAAVRRCP